MADSFIHSESAARRTSDGGRFMTGLPRDIAMEQAAAMVEGAASDPAALKDECIAHQGGSETIDK